MILIATSSLLSLIRLCLIASTDPCTSALIITLSSLTVPALIWSKRPSRESFFLLSSMSLALSCAIKVSEAALASLSSLKLSMVSPELGTPLSPKISTGIDGPASVTLFPLSSSIALTLPKDEPIDMESPTCKVPFCTRTVATGPLPLSRLASITIPLALLLGLALYSATSAVKSTISRSCSIPSLECAETGTNMVEPPQSSGMSSYSVSSCFTLSTFALGLSILLIATIISIPAALA